MTDSSASTAPVRKYICVPISDGDYSLFIHDSIDVKIEDLQVTDIQIGAETINM